MGTARGRKGDRRDDALRRRGPPAHVGQPRGEARNHPLTILIVGQAQAASAFCSGPVTVRTSDDGAKVQMYATGNAAATVEIPAAAGGSWHQITAVAAVGHRRLGPTRRVSSPFPATEAPAAHTGGGGFLRCADSRQRPPYPDAVSLPRRLLGPLLAAGVVLGAAPAVAVDEPAPDDPPVRVMLLGDSVTEGSSGDWTWRYRLWNHLQDVGETVDFVGPSSSVEPTGSDPEVYADPGFDRDHAAQWGRWAVEGTDMVAGLVTEHRPDVLVVNLGINDLIWGTQAWIVEFILADLVRNAQAADPDLDVVLGELTQTWMVFEDEPRARMVNAALRGLAERLTTDASTVVVAATADGYDRADTYDDSHPAASGEVKIAAAVADALAGLGVGGPYPRPLPVVPSTPSVAPTVSATAGAGRVNLSWTRVPGATGYSVTYSGAGASGPTTVTVDEAKRRAGVTGLKGGSGYTFQVRAHKGTSVGVAGKVAATPVPLPPTRIRAVRERTRLAVTWRSKDTYRYRVRMKTTGRRPVVRTVSAPRVVFRRLKPGAKHVVTVRAVGAGVAGPAVRKVYATRR